jgi:hypothetical protein
MNSTTSSSVLRELATRTAGGFTVMLLWRPGDADVLLRVGDESSGNSWDLRVPGHEALEAFNHPFAYAS